MNNLIKIIERLNTNPESIEFEDTINVIEEYYTYTPARFCNGLNEDLVINEASENEGSCKIFTFAKIQGLNQNQTLNCFGKYYRDEVLKHPDKSNHANIRAFIKYGWDGIQFDELALFSAS